MYQQVLINFADAVHHYLGLLIQMAKLLTPEGDEIEVEVPQIKDERLGFYKQQVGVRIEPIYGHGDWGNKVMLINDEGDQLGLLRNAVATELAKKHFYFHPGVIIKGNALLLTVKEEID